MRVKDYSRFELKYVLSRDQYHQLTEVLATYLNPDTYGDSHGRYAITSLYYDSPDYRAYWDKIEGHRFRRKVRVRVYGRQNVTPESNCFVEIKQRINKTVQKKRVVLPYAQALALCGSGQPVENANLSDTDLATISEVQYLHHTQQLQPACIVGYDRIAFEGSTYDPSLRVTFDTNLHGRVHELSLAANGFDHNYFFMRPDQCVMEVKVNYRVPYWLTELIGRYHCTLRRVSKYCAALETSKILLQQHQFAY